MKSICALVLLALVSAALAQAVTFGYDDSSTSLPGPSSWATLPGSAVCSTGRFQSPLNILSSFAAYYANYGNLAFSYSPDTTIQITETGSGVSLTSTGFSNNLLSVSNVLNGSYVLSSVNFHWAQDNTHGSEHQIDFEPGSGEIQFVHYSTQYSSLQAAIASNQPQAVAVVAVLLVVQNSSPKNLTALINAMNTTSGPMNSVYPGSIDFTTLLPANRKYYTYSGSLTTPSCNEVAQWFVLSHYTRISPNDIARLRKVPLQLSATTYGVGSNDRPVQTQGLRKVTANFIPNNGGEDAASMTVVSMAVVGLVVLIGMLF